MYVVYRDNNDRFLGRYCGLTAPGPVESPRGAVGLRITLHTDQENVASGFKARYFFETPRTDVAECGGNFSNLDSGIITSPNYPAGYKAPSRGMASMACNWIMTARPGYKLSINFEHFSIEGDPASEFNQNFMQLKSARALHFISFSSFCMVQIVVVLLLCYAFGLMLTPINRRWNCVVKNLS